MQTWREIPALFQSAIGKRVCSSSDARPKRRRGGVALHLAPRRRQGWCGRSSQYYCLHQHIIFYITYSNFSAHCTQGIFFGSNDSVFCSIWLRGLHRIAFVDYFFLLIPGSIERQLNKLAAWSSGSRQNSFTRLSKLSKRLAGHIAIYQESFARFLCEHKLVIFNVFLITGIYHLLKLNLAYIILLALGIEIDYLTAMAILALLKFILYFSPTPGGSGVGELSIAALFATLMPLHMLPIYTVLYRFFCLILPAAFGAWIVMREMKTGIPAA